MKRQLQHSFKLTAIFNRRIMGYYSYNEVMERNKAILHDLKVKINQSLRNQKLEVVPPSIANSNQIYYDVNDLMIDDIDNDTFCDNMKLSVSFRIDLFINENSKEPEWSCVYAPHRKSEYWNVVISKKTGLIKKIPNINVIISNS